MKNPVLIEKNFSREAKNLRNFFLDQFNDPHQAHSKRFVWDYWNVPGQYRLVRTPAYHYFPSKIYQNFHSQLVQWGRENLGCHDISPPWLSYYVDGCRQNFHSDVPHGPWAFVFSLSPSELTFKGGETVIMKPETLNYWNKFQNQANHEEDEFFYKIPPKFNNLIVFDPRFPHAVSEVKGPEDPREGRLVIHGWFVQPRPYVVGGHSVNQIGTKLKILFKDLSRLALDKYCGTYCVRLQISRTGEVLGLKDLSNTLISTDGNNSDQELILEIKKRLRTIQFGRAPRSSQVTLPIVFT